MPSPVVVTPHKNSVIAAQHGENINVPMTYSGTMNGKLFLCWLKDMLVPSLEKGAVVIMDNASIHKMSEVKDAIDKTLQNTKRYFHA